MYKPDVRVPGPSNDSEAMPCWICLDTEEKSGDRLLQPCLCPRLAHERCLARWQLQNAGKSEEAYCRFCELQLPDWAEAYKSMPKGDPLLSVSHEGTVYLINVKAGEEGRQAFMAIVRGLCGLSEGQELELSFGCKVPGSPGEYINLEGWDCFDAAVHCAAICAGQRGSKALNLAEPDAVPPPAHAVVATASPPSMEPYYLMEDSQEIPGCWKLLRETFSDLWGGFLDRLRKAGTRIADEAQALRTHWQFSRIFI